jgi:hypothetical protein
MQKAQYEMIAQIMLRAKPIKPAQTDSTYLKHRYEGEMENWMDIIRRMGIVFSEDNPKFKISLFEKACGKT